MVAFLDDDDDDGSFVVDVVDGAVSVLDDDVVELVDGAVSVLDDDVVEDDDDDGDGGVRGSLFCLSCCKPSAAAAATSDDGAPDKFSFPIPILTPVPILVSCEGVFDKVIPSRLDEPISRARLCCSSPVMLLLEDDNRSLGRIEISTPAFLSPLGKEILNSLLPLDIEDDTFPNSSRRAPSADVNLERLEKLGKLS